MENKEVKIMSKLIELSASEGVRITVTFASAWRLLYSVRNLSFALSSTTPGPSTITSFDVPNTVTVKGFGGRDGVSLIA